jgi:hypothetical protein
MTNLYIEDNKLYPSETISIKRIIQHFIHFVNQIILVRTGVLKIFNVRGNGNHLS